MRLLVSFLIVFNALSAQAGEDLLIENVTLVASNLKAPIANRNVLIPSTLPNLFIISLKVILETSFKYILAYLDFQPYFKQLTTARFAITNSVLSSFCLLWFGTKDIN